MLGTRAPQPAVHAVIAFAFVRRSLFIDLSISSYAIIFLSRALRPRKQHRRRPLSQAAACRDVPLTALPVHHIAALSPHRRLCRLRNHESHIAMKQRYFACRQSTALDPSPQIPENTAKLIAVFPRCRPRLSGYGALLVRHYETQTDAKHHFAPLGPATATNRVRQNAGGSDVFISLCRHCSLPT